MSARECRGSVLTRILEQHGKEEKAVRAWVVGWSWAAGRAEGEEKEGLGRGFAAERG